MGFFTISEYQKIIANVVSFPIWITSSPPTDHVILHLRSPDLEFSSSSLVFHRNSSLNETFRVAAREPGYYFIKYCLSGPSAHEFSLPEEDILFVKPENSTAEDTSKQQSILNFPSGCHKKQIGVCPELGHPIIATSTSPFVAIGPLFVTKGIVSIEIGNLTKIPLSLRGISLPQPSTAIIQDSCINNDVRSYSTESLIKSRTLPQSFANSVAEALPSWIKIAMSNQSFVKKILSSDLMTHFLTGRKLLDAGIGEGLSVDDDMFYSLLSTKYVNVTIQNDQDVLKSSGLSLAIELCGKLPSNIILHPFSHVPENLLNNVGTFKSLKQYGWHFNFHSVQFSKTNTIERPKKENFWDGKNFFDIPASSDGTFAAALALKKYFINSTFAHMRMEFNGTLIARINDIDQVKYSVFYILSFTRFTVHHRPQLCVELTGYKQFIRFLVNAVVAKKLLASKPAI